MTFQKVNIYHLTTGRNGVSPDAAVDVDNGLGAFTWRTSDFAGSLPRGAALVTTVDFKTSASPMLDIAFAMVEHFPGHENGGLILDISGRLIEKITVE